MSEKNSVLRIGDLAKATGLGVETLRFYEQRGLILPMARQSSGYRIYDPETVHRLHFVQKSKALGFSLEEIKQLLELSNNVNESCHNVRGQVCAKLAEVQARIRDLQNLEQSLATLLNACDGSASIAHCPIVQSLQCQEPCHV